MCLDPADHPPSGAVHPFQSVDLMANQDPMHSRCRNSEDSTDAGRPELVFRAEPHDLLLHAGAVWCGHDRGRLERSSGPATPSARYRFHHFDAHCREMFIDSAAAVIDPARLDPFAQSRASFGCEWGVTVHKSLLWQVRLPSTAPHSPGGHLIQDPASTTSKGTTPRPDGRHRARGRFRSRCRRDGRRLRGDLHRVPMDRGYLHPHPAFLGGTILGQRFLSTIMWLFASSWRSAPPGRPTAAPPRE